MPGMYSTHIPPLWPGTHSPLTFISSNKAQLRELEHIRTNLLHSRKSLALPSSGAGAGSSPSKPTSIRPFLVAARFVARMRISARGWAKQEAVRRKLVAATEEQRRVKRSRQLKVVRVTEETSF